jgi:hypothetical protein
MPLVHRAADRSRQPQESQVSPLIPLLISRL